MKVKSTTYDNATHDRATCHLLCDGSYVRNTTSRHTSQRRWDLGSGLTYVSDGCGMRLFLSGECEGADLTWPTFPVVVPTMREAGSNVT